MKMRVRPGVGAGEAKRIIQQRDAALARIPEVQMVLGKIGRAETATDMAPLSMIETIAVLKDKSQWRPEVSYDSRDYGYLTGELVVGVAVSRRGRGRRFAHSRRWGCRTIDAVGITHAWTATAG